MGRVVAGLAFMLGLLNIALGFSIATGFIVEPEPGYFLRGRLIGEVIDRGIYEVIFAIILGILADISRSLSTST